MKYILITACLVFTLPLLGQTDSIEKAILYNKVLEKEISKNKYTELGLYWNRVKKKFGYPELDRNPSGQVHLSVLNELPACNKEYIFNRTLEWLAINYELYPQHMFSSFETGKIIYTYSYSIDSEYTCVYTAIITIKNNKLLFEMLNIKYLVYHPGYYYNNSWVNERTETIPAELLYPIIIKDVEVWEAYMKILSSCKELFEADKSNLKKYILEYKELSGF